MDRVILWVTMFSASLLLMWLEITVIRWLSGWPTDISMIAALVLSVCAIDASMAVKAWMDK